MFNNRMSADQLKYDERLSLASTRQEEEYSDYQHGMWRLSIDLEETEAVISGLIETLQQLNKDINAIIHNYYAANDDNYITLKCLTKHYEEDLYNLEKKIIELHNIYNNKYANPDVKNPSLGCTNEN